MNVISIPIVYEEPDEVNESITQFDEVLMFDEEHINRLLTNHPDFRFLSHCSFSREKGWQGSWKTQLCMENIQEFFNKYGIYLYYGYNTTLMRNARVETVIMNESETGTKNVYFRKFTIYTNTNLVLKVIESDDSKKRGTNIENIKISVFIDNTEIFQIINTEFLPKINYSILFKNKSYLLTDEIPDIDDIIETQVVREVHPYVYADYLYLSSPKDSQKLLLDGKLNMKLSDEISCLHAQMNTLNQKLYSKHCDYVEEKIKNRQLSEENERLREEIKTLSKKSQINNKYINYLKGKINSLVEYYCSTKEDSDSDHDEDDEPNDFMHILYHTHVCVFASISFIYIAGIAYTVFSK